MHNLQSDESRESDGGTEGEVDGASFIPVLDDGYNSRMINQLIFNLFGIKSEPDVGVVVTEPIRDLIADLRKSARGLFRLVLSNLETASLKDGIYQSTVERTNSAAVSQTADRIVGEHGNKTFQARMNGQIVTRSYRRESLKLGVTAVLSWARIQAEFAWGERHNSSGGYY